ncbi:MAG: hypothetical protein H0X03_01120 [Nitrosopumilus sp.]|nr:hypothetical protein [Nitrosopumilus sp.]
MFIVGFLINDINPALKYMRKLTIFIPVCLISMILVIVDGNVSSSQIVLANDEFEKLDISNQFSLHSYDSANHFDTYQDSSVLLPLSSEINSDLFSSFSNIISTQISSGLNNN